MDLVTFCIYMKNSSYTKSKMEETIAKESNRIATIMNGLSSEAIRVQNPKLVCRVFFWLIHDNNRDNHSVQAPNRSRKDNEDAKMAQYAQNYGGAYKRNRDACLKLFKFELERRLKRNRSVEVALWDFSLQASLEDCNYLNCIALSEGNILDLMKFKVIGFYKNHRHLQLDSSSVIWDYAGFYNKTFGAPGEHQTVQFLLNVYSEGFFSINNKIMYVPRNHRFSVELSNAFERHCNRKWGHYRHNNRDSDDAKYNRLYLYVDVFIPVLGRMGFLDANKFISFDTILNESPDPFLITRYVHSKRQQSWKKHQKAEQGVSIKTIVSNDGLIDFLIFEQLLQKHTTLFSYGYPMSNHQSLLSRYADVEHEHGVMREFLSLAYAQNRQETLDFIAHKSTFLLNSARNSGFENAQTLADNTVHYLFRIRDQLVSSSSMSHALNLSPQNMDPNSETLNLSEVFLKGHSLANEFEVPLLDVSNQPEDDVATKRMNCSSSNLTAPAAFFPTGETNTNAAVAHKAQVKTESFVQRKHPKQPGNVASYLAAFGLGSK